MTLDNLPRLIDQTSGTVMTCKNIRQIGKRIEQGKPVPTDDLITLIQDFAVLRYRYTLNCIQHQAMELLSRTWDS